MLQWSAALTATTDVDGAAAGGARRVDGGALELDILAGDGDRTAGSVPRGRDQTPGDPHFAAGAAADDDRSTVPADRARLHQAGNVDGVARAFPRRRGRDDDAAAIGLDGTGVLDQRALAAGAGRHRHLQKAVAGEVERRLFA